VQNVLSHLLYESKPDAKSKKKIRKKKRPETSEESEESIGSPALLCSAELGGSGGEGSDGVISLSDEDLQLPSKEPPKRKKKPPGGPVRKKLRPRSQGTAVKQEEPSKEQEEVLLAAFRQWPVPLPSLVAALAQETGLEGTIVRSWFLRTRADCLRLLWEQGD
jgi:hypothetical protein